MSITFIYHWDKILAVFLLRFYIPAVWSIIFRAVAFGYKSKRRFILGLVLYTAYVLFVPATLMTVLGYGQFTHMASIVMTAGSMMVLIFSTDSVSKTIFLQLSQGAMVTVLSVLLSMFRTIFHFSYTMLLVLFCICSPILFFVALRYWAKPMRFLVDNIADDAYLSLLVLPLFILFIITVIPIYPPQNFANHPIFCSILMIVIEMAYFIYLTTMYHNLRHISDLSRQGSFMELLDHELKAYQSFLDTARKSNHDIRHHDAVLLEQLEEGHQDEAISYLKEHDKTIKESSLKQYCVDSTINALLRIYEKRSAEAKVSFFAKVTCDKTIPLEGPETCSVLGNILENALHAASKKLDGFINCSIVTKGNSFLLEVRNTVTGKTEFRGGMPVSKRANGGTGTRSVRSIVEKHGGVVTYAQDGQEFVTRIMIPLAQFND
jgi:signal transduction histidine kinase